MSKAGIPSDNRCMDSAPIVLCTLNAKYIHASLGLRYLQANMKRYGGVDLHTRTMVREYTIARKPQEVVDGLLTLGNNQLHAIVAEIPNARERLVYVGKMTEDAANKVLTFVEIAKPACDNLGAVALALEQSLSELAADNKIGVERAREQMVIDAKFAARSAAFAKEQGNVLSNIMMAQDFQDLSGECGL